ncbi:hypothetical protein HJC23_013082 [Cyclotella cryptica]|uniref:Carbohydrate kinase FGGY C-terminal domain-containing protein n=1 Tax=Cyclotella cryptica TaxID=29204 RepID=A0ABD3Q6S4_9STRA|eukprot:CCRYP_008121-RA/>CCRYP_008121-RA protein AED:0.00 eAED:0.00 QI:142/-1/1/1/-1/1/1/28/1008
MTFLHMKHHSQPVARPSSIVSMKDRKSASLCMLSRGNSALVVASLTVMMMASWPLRCEAFSTCSSTTKAMAPRTATVRPASLRDLLDDGESRKKEDTGREENKADNFFSKINNAYTPNRGFPVRKLAAPADVDDERGQHVDRLGTWSFAASAGTQKKLADRIPQRKRTEAGDADNAQIDEAMQADGGSPAGSDKVNAADVLDELAPDNFNNRDIHISKHKFPNRDSSATSSQAMNDDHAQALKTFSFASQQSKKEPNAAASTADSGSSRAYSKSMADRMDRLTTYSLSRSKSEYGIPPTAITTTDVFPSDKVNHIDRLSTFSFASTAPRSGSTTVRSDTTFSSSSDTEKTTDDTSISTEGSNAPSIDLSSPKTKLSQQPTSLSSLALSLSTTTRNDRIKEVKSKNDPRIIHPDGMNIPRLNSGGSVMSMSRREGKKNIFQRIEGRDVDENQEQTGDSNREDGLGDTGFGASNIDWGDLGEIFARDTKDDDDASGSNQEPNGSKDCFIGFDLGTSGARISIVEKRHVEQDSNKNSWEYVEVFAAALSWDDILHYDDAYDWRSAVDALLMRAAEDVPDIMARVKAVCVSGTSATCLLLERGTLDVSRVARMYNFDVLGNSDSGKEEGTKKKGKSGKGELENPAERVMKLIEDYVPEKHTARATTGSLAKLLLWNEEESLVDDEGFVREMLCHQSDYISMSLMHGGMEQDEECFVTSDWHNSLKLGYDVEHLSYPEWMLKLLKEGAKISSPKDVLPSKVVSPGEPMGLISPIVAMKYGLPTDAVLVGGTTDSNAAFFAAAGARPEFGQAVTSLGSTVALKQLSKSFVEDASRGVYSHRFPRFGSGGKADEVEEAWLIGGASNVGCAVLRQEGFSNEELESLSSEIDPNTDSPLSYYPLTKKGERFPIADSEKTPVLDPKPEDRKEYLHGILQAIGDVERDGYRILGELGARPSRPTEVLTCGGGSKNDMWTAMRERRLRDICNGDQRIVVKKALNTEASYGAALLAAASFE